MSTLIAQDNFSSGALASQWTPIPTLGETEIVNAPPFVSQPSVLNTSQGQLWTKGTAWPNDQESLVKIFNLSAPNHAFVSLQVRFSTGSQQGYQLNIGNGLSNIYRFDNNVATLLSSIAATPANGDTWTFKAQGSTITALQNGVAINSAVDATYTSGFPGFSQNVPPGGLITDSQMSLWQGISVSDSFNKKGWVNSHRSFVNLR